MSEGMDLTDVHRLRRHEAPAMEAMAKRVLMALARRAGEGDLEALEALAELDDFMPNIMGAGVAGYRNKLTASWAQVAQVLGVTRQAAQQRFGTFTVDAAHGPRCKCGQRQCPRNQLQLEGI